VEDILAAALAGDDGFPAGAAGKIRSAADYLAVAPQAVRGRIDAPVAEVDDELHPEPRDPERLDALAHEFGIVNSVHRMRAAIAKAVAAW